jgi:RecA/RadA recombinase
LKTWSFESVKEKRTMTDLWRAARAYLKMGLHPIPCRPRNKRPLFDWLPYQTQQPTLSEIDAWWGEHPDANVALVVGRGIMVADLDGPHAGRLLGEAGIELPAGAPRVKTGHGRHVYLAPSEGVRNRTAVLSVEVDGVKSQLDIRADGGYVLAPPSIHPNGSRYTWEVSLVFPLPPAPGVLLELVRERKPAEAHTSANGSAPDWITTALRGVSEGSRDDTAARLAGYFVSKGHPEDVVLELMAQFAGRCSPPLPLGDIRRIVQSVRRADARHPKQQDDKSSSEDKRSEAVHISVVMERTLELIQHPKVGIKTPFKALNHLIIGGFGKGELTYLGARPGVGKTTLAVQIARHAASKGKKVLVVSLEMLLTGLGRKLIGQEGKLSAKKLKLGTVDMTDASKSAELLRRLQIWINDQARSMDDVNRTIDRLCSEHGELDLVIVDYLQIMAAPREIREKRLQIDFLSQELKSLAMTREIPVLCLSSLSRPTSANQEPTLASLRESGELEHDADIVMFLHPVMSDADGMIETLCIVAKNRDGETGRARLLFDPKLVNFSEIDQPIETEGDGNDVG